MNEQFIQGVIFDWNRVDNNSYLKKIEAFKGVEKLDFNKSITFFVGENGSGKCFIYVRGSDGDRSRHMSAGNRDSLIGGKDTRPHLGA